MGIRNLKLPTNLGFNTPQIVDISDQLPINPYWTWFTMPTRKDASGNYIAGPRDVNALTTIALHHTASPKSAGATAAVHAQNHINNKAYSSKGEPGIPYHIYIKDGQAVQVNDLLAFTYGVASNNYQTVHIVVEGNYAGVDVLTDPDRSALYGAILAVKAALPGVTEIKGHNEMNATECPGYDCNRVRADIKNYEMLMAQDSTWSAKIKFVGDIVNQINYMNNLIKAGESDGNAQWAMQQQLALRELMIERNLLKP